MDLAISILMIAGSVWVLIAALGIVRMPDFFTRVQVVTKATTFGLGMIMLATALNFGWSGESARSLLAVAFIFLTSPVAAHMLSRTAYKRREVDLWEGTEKDEWAILTGVPRPKAGEQED